MSTETQYADLADLRGALRSDNEDVLQSAYEAVYDAGTKPSVVLGSDPPRTLLEDAGVIPEAGTAGPPVAQRIDRVIELLESIEANTGGS